MDNGYKSVVTATFDQYGNLLTRETKEDGEKEIVTFTYDFDKREIIAKKADEDYPKRIYLFDENGYVYVYSSQYYPFKNVKNTNIYSYDQQQQLCKEINIKENDNVYGITIDSIEVSYSFTLDGFWKQKDIRESSKRLDKDKEGNFKEPVFDMAESSIVYFDVKKDSQGNIIGYAEKSANDKIRVVTRSIIYIRITGVDYMETYRLCQINCVKVSFIPKNSSVGERPRGKGRDHPSRRAQIYIN